MMYTFWSFVIIEPIPIFLKIYMHVTDEADINCFQFLLIFSLLSRVISFQIRLLSLQLVFVPCLTIYFTIYTVL